MRAKYIRGDEVLRFFAKVDKTDTCWFWMAGLKDGYGAFRTADMVTVRAHKWLWERVNGSTPKGLELDHQCDNRSCVNPNHLKAVTHTENVRRAPVRKRNWRTLKITHCPQGHEYSEENTYIPKHRFQRICKTCKNERLKKWRKRIASVM